MLNIAYTVNHVYIKYLYVSLMSLLECNANNAISVNILSFDLVKEDKDLITELVRNYGKTIYFYDIDDIDVFVDKASEGYGVEVYLRLYMPFVLKGVSKVLFLDADTIIQNDLVELFETDLKGHALAACLDSKLGQNSLKSRNDLFCRGDDLRYFNAGVMIWNLDYIRENISFEDYLHTIDLFGNRLFYNDQDVLKYLFCGKIIDLGTPMYNFMPDMFFGTEAFDELIQSARIIHYAGCNPWKAGKNDRIDSVIWWGYAQRTPFYEEIVEEALRSTASSLNEIKKKMEIYQAYSEFKLNGRSLKDCEIVDDSRSIVIYGAGAWGRLLLEEMGELAAKVKYIVDKRDRGKINGHIVEGVDRIAEDTSIDLIIITPYKYVDEIRKELETIVNVPIISVKELFS